MPGVVSGYTTGLLFQLGQPPLVSAAVVVLCVMALRDGHVALGCDVEVFFVRTLLVVLTVASG